MKSKYKYFKKVKYLDQYFINDFDDKELKSKIFKLKLAHFLKIIDKKLFEKIFGHILEALAIKLTNTANKEENQKIVKNIYKNRDKLYEMDPFNNDWMIQPSDRRIDLIDVIDLILDFNENENVNDKTLVLSDKNDKDETIIQIKTKNLNDYFDKIIDKSKSFEDQIESIKKSENLNQYCSINDFNDKELISKIFKLKFVDMSNYIDKKLFEQIFGDTLETLANKLINTTNKEENQIIIKNIKEHKKKVHEQEKSAPYDWVIQPDYQRINSIKAIKLILDFNETIQLDLV